MKKSELNKLKAMQKKCDKLANDANKMADEVYAFAPKITDMQLLYNATDELQKAMVNLFDILPPLKRVGFLDASV